VYDDPLVHQQAETHWGNFTSIGPRSAYDESERFAEALSMAWVRERGVDVGIVPIFTPVARAFGKLVRRGGSVGPRGVDEELEEWLANVSEGRDRRDLLGSSNFDDVAYPIGGPASTFEQTADEIQGLCISLTNLVWPVSSLGLNRVHGPG
jgi:hypothetical protein